MNTDTATPPTPIGAPYPRPLGVGSKLHLPLYADVRSFR